MCKSFILHHFLLNISEFPSLNSSLSLRDYIRLLKIIVDTLQANIAMQFTLQIYIANLHCKQTLQLQH